MLFVQVGSSCWSGLQMESRYRVLKIKEALRMMVPLITRTVLRGVTHRSHFFQKSTRAIEIQVEACLPYTMTIESLLGFEPHCNELPGVRSAT